MLSAYLIGRVLLEKRRAEEQAAAGAGEAAPPPSAAEPESSAPPADGDGDSLVHHKLALSVAVNEGLGLFSLRLGRHGPLARGSRGGSGVEAASGEEDLFAGLSPEDLDIHPPEEDAAAQHGGAAADAEADAAAAAELREAGEGPPRPGACRQRAWLGGAGRHCRHETQRMPAAGSTCLQPFALQAHGRTVLLRPLCHCSTSALW